MTPVKSLFSKVLRVGDKVQSKDGLRFQRLFCGALVGCVAAIVLAESPVLSGMELTMLEWRYQIADKISAFFQPPRLSKDISLVKIDDQQQFDLAIANFRDQKGQGILAQAVKNVERGKPALVVIDLDLHGACNSELVQTFAQYKNIVLALFGDLEEGSSALPATELLARSAAFGYEELDAESNGVVCRLPVEYHEAAGFAPLPSLTEAVVDCYRQIKGIGPSSQFLSFRTGHPLYINYRRIQYPSARLEDLIKPGFNSNTFKDRIVLIGSEYTQRENDPLKRRTPLQQNRPTQPNSERVVPNLLIHADSISTLLDGAVIRSFPQNISHHFLLLLGAIFGAIASILPLGRRFFAYIACGSFLLILAQISFQCFNLVIPIVSSFAVLTLSLLIGTFIYLDTDLRLRNRELGEARKSMQARAEEERQRIAEDLHDETLPALSAVARLADQMRSEFGGNPIPGEMREKLDFAVTEMRRVINDLHPSVLETMGFKPALENLLSILRKEANVEVSFIDADREPDYGLSNFAKLQLYRIIQEALNNIQKHAQAKLVELKLSSQNGDLIMSVTDNGNGINLKAIRYDSHGLLNIKQRAQLIGAHVEWKKPNQFPTGTELKLRIPINTNQNEG